MGDPPHFFTFGYCDRRNFCYNRNSFRSNGQSSFRCQGSQYIFGRFSLLL